MKVLNSLSILSMSVAILLPRQAFANPKGGQIKAGSASFEEGASALMIRQSSDRGIIHWQDFSIGAGEITKFIQPGANSAILNRVVGGNSSALLGALQANGKVYLINPNGILIGPGARIDTGSFVASTLDVSDVEFMAGGDMKFVGPSTAAVTNLGTINASSGDIFLIAREVGNAGTLNAPDGVVGLGAGSEVLLKAAGDERLFVSAGSGGSVTNSGTIAATQAELKAGGGSPYGLAVNNTGVIRATGVVNRNGRVLLTASGGTVQNTGTISAKNANGSGGHVRMDSGAGGRTVNAGTIDASGKSPGQKGGRVEVLGETVELAAGSLIDVSGDFGGGVALVGGDEKGGNPAVPNSKNVTVAKGAVINADAITSGDGGRVIVWADETTQFDGFISARGGAEGGNGGFVETSGKLHLAMNGLVDAAAPAGQPGMWLLDPSNTTLGTPPAPGGSTLPTTAPSIAPDPVPGTTYTPTGNDTFIDVGPIATALNAGTSVTIKTSGAGAQAGDITVASNIAKTAGGASTLQLDADGAIFVNANIDGSATGNLNVTMNAVGSVTGAGSILANVLSITSSNGGNITLTGAVVVNNLTANIPVQFPGPTFNGAVQMINGANQIGTIDGITAQQGVNVFDSAGGLIVNGAVIASQQPGSAANAVLRTVGNFTISGTGSISSNSPGDIFIEANGGFFINNGGALALNSSSGWAVYSLSNAAPSNAGGLVANTADGTYNPPSFSTADVTTKQFLYGPAVTPGGGGGGTTNPPPPAGFSAARRFTGSSVQTQPQFDPVTLNFLRNASIQDMEYYEYWAARDAGVAAWGQRTVDAIHAVWAERWNEYVEFWWTRELGWPPIPGVPYDIQWAYMNVAKFRDHPLTREDMQAIVDGGGLVFNAEQIRFLSTQNLFYLVGRGGGYTRGLEGYGEYLGAWQLPGIMAGGVTTLQKAGGGALAVNGLFYADAQARAQLAPSVLPGSNQLKIALPNSVLQAAQGSSLKIVSDYGVVKLLGQDGASLANLSNLLGQDGASLLGQDGASLLGQDGASLRSLGINLLGQDGASLLGQDGASISGARVNALLGQDGASFHGPNASLIGSDAASMRMNVNSLVRPY